MKRGDIVRYSKPVEGEATFRFVLLAAPEKERADIQLICEERIKPIETVAVTEIELASSDDRQSPTSPRSRDRPVLQPR